jgi:uncharacterized membrane protein
MNGYILGACIAILVYALGFWHGSALEFWQGSRR